MISKFKVSSLEVIASEEDFAPSYRMVLRYMQIPPGSEANLLGTFERRSVRPGSAGYYRRSTRSESAATRKKVAASPPVGGRLAAVACCSRADNLTIISRTKSLPSPVGFGWLSPLGLYLYMLSSAPKLGAPLQRFPLAIFGRWLPLWLKRLATPSD